MGDFWGGGLKIYKISLKAFFLFLDLKDERSEK